MRLSINMYQCLLIAINFYFSHHKIAEHCIFLDPSILCVNGATCSNHHLQILPISRSHTKRWIYKPNVKHFWSGKCAVTFGAWSRSKVFAVGFLFRSAKYNEDWASFSGSRWDIMTEIWRFRVAPVVRNQKCEDHLRSAVVWGYVLFPFSGLLKNSLISIARLFDVRVQN